MDFGTTCTRRQELRDGRARFVDSILPRSSLHTNILFTSSPDLIARKHSKHKGGEIAHELDMVGKEVNNDMRLQKRQECIEQPQIRYDSL